MTGEAFAERWLSGRKRRFAKPLYGQKPYRGFESPSLRHFFSFHSKSCSKIGRSTQSLFRMGRRWLNWLGRRRCRRLRRLHGLGCSRNYGRRRLHGLGRPGWTICETRHRVRKPRDAVGHPRHRVRKPRNAVGHPWRGVCKTWKRLGLKGAGRLLRRANQAPCGKSTQKS